MKTETLTSAFCYTILNIKLTMVRSTKIAAATAALVWSADSVMAQNDNGFRRIATDFGDSKPKGVVLPTICIGSFLVPKTMYTFEPTTNNNTNVTIRSNPRNLVETGYDSDDGLVYFKFNQTVAEVAEDAGVVVQFPADQLETINVCCSQSVQIKNGFTNLQNLTVSTSATVNASFVDETAGNMTIDISRGGLVNVRAPNGKRIVVSANEATANVLGNITSISCTDQSTCRVTGSIMEPSESEVDRGSTIKNKNCEGIDIGVDSVCQTKVPAVRVVTSTPLVISGVKETCVGGDGLFGAFGPNEPPTEAPTLSPAPTVSKAPTMKPTKAPTPKPSTLPPVEPEGETPTDSGAVGVATKEKFMSIAFGAAISLFLLVGQ